MLFVIVNSQVLIRFFLFSRFLINIPEEERRDIVRLCFQIETAHWFYVDFHRQENPELPPCGLKDFTKINILFNLQFGLNIYGLELKNSISLFFISPSSV